MQRITVLIRPNYVLITIFINVEKPNPIILAVFVNDPRSRGQGKGQLGPTSSSLTLRARKLPGGNYLLMIIADNDFTAAVPVDIPAANAGVLASPADMHGVPIQFETRHKVRASNP